MRNGQQPYAVRLVSVLAESIGGNTAAQPSRFKSFGFDGRIFRDYYPRFIRGRFYAVGVCSFYGVVQQKGDWFSKNKLRIFDLRGDDLHQFPFVLETLYKLYFLMLVF